MALQPVHVLTKDLVTGRAGVTHINPTRMYAEGSASGITWYANQNGEWFDTAGNPMDESQVPEKYRLDAEKNPVNIPNSGPSITKVCQFCKEKMNSSQMEEHLLGHVQNLMSTAGAPAEKGKKA